MRSLLVLFTFATVAQAAPPNIVFVIGDDQGMADYGFLGHPHIRTPHIDKLAAESLQYTRGHVPTSLCRASLATMITGLYAHQHKMTSNDPPYPPGKANSGQAAKDPEYIKLREEMVKLFEQSPNLAKMLSEKGFVSSQSGKWWEGNACRCGGFTEGMTVGDPTKGGRHGDVGLTIGRQGLKPVFDFVDQAKKDNKPFYVWYAPMMPHQPHTPPARLLDYYKTKTDNLFVAKYWAMCEWFDETVGDLLKHLEEQGLKENTIVIYLHDNGWIQDTTKDTFAAKSKKSPYEGGLQTPILIRWPGHVKPAKNDTPVSSIDLVPTVLAAVGLKPTKDMRGINLLDAEAVKARPAVFGETFEHSAIDIYTPAKNLQFRWMMDGRWKLIVPNLERVPKEVVELYDLSTDPKEETNLAAKHPDRVEAMRKSLDAYWNGK
jgi:arylsulfatase A-like enzyme